MDTVRNPPCARDTSGARQPGDAARAGRKPSLASSQAPPVARHAGAPVRSSGPPTAAPWRRMTCKKKGNSDGPI